MPEPFEYDDERKVATGNGITITRLCDGDMNRVRAIKGIGGAQYQVEWLRVVVDDVRIYINHDGNVVISKWDLMP
ncbi:hypothetical protein UFOVP1672_15 [uncultured Caudovirales phage]|uniref:Uncharacterized protein n=1 Tax=uncultured Caudovirales phage TaxID=2100421 RepID=A0A6J5SAJ8_9CAUD|nr:hypothetical protein UFOVP988_37 [uncultured Caudovirales phage]CAB4210745.1 hypothetical protein UFOVP1425_37 [uncultured Caudovirales phage]CAB4223304.1 hypothetical protein UFOVP1672_15 [uncultured Caudovirales phage]